jgi:hypothetical protein
VEEISEVEGIGPAVAERILAALTGQPGGIDSVRDASLEDAAGN